MENASIDEYPFAEEMWLHHGTPHQLMNIFCCTKCGFIMENNTSLKIFC